MASTTIIFDNLTLNITDNIDKFVPVPVLARELKIYKISNYVLDYLVVPFALWGCVGNFFSFR